MAATHAAPSRVPKQARSVGKFLADKALPLVTSLFGLLAAVLTLVSMSATSENADLEDELRAVESPGGGP